MKVNETPQTVLVVGASGRLGRVTVEEFGRRGWRVRAMLRAPKRGAWTGAREIVEGDARFPCDLIAAADGADVIVNAVNPPFARWDTDAFEVTESMIAAARASGAVHLFPGNIYNFGWPLPEVISEVEPQRPTTRKGAIRVEIERRLREAADLYGVRTIVLRAGDYYGGGRGSWFDTVIAGGLARGRMVYPGPLNLPHGWAYLPDVAVAFEALARQRRIFEPYETFHFPGHTVKGDELAAELQAALGYRVRTSQLPWRLFRFAAPFVPMWRELSELAYLWHAPHRLEGAKLQMAVGDLPATPFDRAVRDSLASLGFDTRPGAPAVAKLAPV